MSRLPTVGEDNDQWGSILNEYLSVEHNTDGTQKLLTEDVSRTIYVATTGDDTTGDGTSLLPYATVGKALSVINKQIDTGITTTISFGSGTFTFSLEDQKKLLSFVGSGTIVFEGLINLATSGFVMGAPQALDPFTFAVSGGSSSSWSVNQWRTYFLKSGSNYEPITHNTTTTISTAGNLTGTEIYQNLTTLNLIPTDIYVNSAFTFNKLNINASGLVTFRGSFERVFSITNCNITAGGTIQFSEETRYNSMSNYFTGGQVVVACIFGNNFSRNYIYNDLNLPAIDFYYGIRSSPPIQLVVENPNTGSNAGGMICSSVMNGGGVAAATYTKFVNCYVGIMYNNFLNQTFNTQGYQKFILVNTSYMFRKRNSNAHDYAPITFSVKLSNILGTPITRWCYDNIYEFINDSTGRNFQISGLIYPESEQGLSASLTDNATTNIIVGNKLQNRSIVIDYTITRGTSYEVNRLVIVNKGATVVLSEGTLTGDDVAVSFAVSFATNDIQLACTLTSTGTPATMKYNATRVMITPLTI